MKDDEWWKIRAEKFARLLDKIVDGQKGKNVQPAFKSIRAFTGYDKF